MSDPTFNVSSPGTDATTASEAQLLMSLKYPFAKLDSTNPVSFQNINLTFLNEPPDAPLDGSGFSGHTTYKRTLVYQFPHGYKYQPTTWCMSLSTLEDPDLSHPLAYQNGNMILLGFVGGSLGGATEAVLWVTADKNNVYLYVIKQTQADGNGNFPSPEVQLVGSTVRLRVYVFVENLAGTS